MENERKYQSISPVNVRNIHQELMADQCKHDIYNLSYEIVTRAFTHK